MVTLDKEIKLAGRQGNGFSGINLSSLKHGLSIVTL